MKQALIFSLKVWLTCDVLFPLIAFVGDMRQFHTSLSGVMVYTVLYALIGLFYSLPAFAFLALLCIGLQKLNFNPKQIKLTITLIVLVLTALVSQFNYITINSIVVVVCVIVLVVWFYKLKPVHDADALTS